MKTCPGPLEILEWLEAGEPHDRYAAHIAEDKLAQADVSQDVLWYHATYVAPSWGKRLTRQAQIGLHIFYS